MADEQDHSERSEDPTQKRLDQARERGDVVKSQEVNTLFVIGGGALILMALAGKMAQELTLILRGFVANAHAIRVDGRSLVDAMGQLGMDVVAATAIPLLLLALAAIGGNMVQHQLVWSLEPLKPKLSKISPTAGFKRLFSKV